MEEIDEYIYRTTYFPPYMIELMNLAETMQICCVDSPMGTRKSFKHGWSGYLKFGCRCDVCKQAKRAHQKRYRERLRQRKESEAA
jgi:hypothetical protein